LRHWHWQSDAARLSRGKHVTRDTGTSSSCWHRIGKTNENPISVFPETEIRRPQSQFPHSCVWAIYSMYSQDRSTYFAVAE
jgi:hypothetical protein